MHVSRDQMNAMLHGGLARNERHALVDHLIDCEACSNRFRALRDLDERLHRRDLGRWWRTGIALAAGIALLVGYGLFRNKSPERFEVNGVDLTSVHQDERAQSYDLLARVQQINYQHAVSEWGQTTRATDLINLTGPKSTP